MPLAVDGGAVAVDKSSAYRLEPGVPLVVPEVNAAAALEHDGIVANPNCCTIPLTCVLKPLHDAAGLVRVRVATYQSVSGAGAQSMERLRNEPPAEHDLRMDWEFDGEEFDEESKLRAETQKIMELPELPIQATCVRVPVMVGHAEAVWIETEDDLTPEQARALLGAAPSVRLEEFPTPRQGGRDRRRARRPHPPRPDGRARARALPRERQPAQGRRAERDPDRGARPAPRARSRVELRVRVGMLGRFFPGNWRPPADEVRFAADNGFAAAPDSQRPARAAIEDGARAAILGDVGTRLRRDRRRAGGRDASAA